MTTLHPRSVIGRRVACALAAIVAFASSASAQPARSPEQPVRIAIVEAVPLATARAMVVRSTGQHDLVVIARSDANTTTLGMALALLERLKTQPLPPGQRQVVPIQGGVAVSGVTAARSAILTDVLKRAASRPLRDLGSIGIGRTLMIDLRSLER